MFQKQTAEPFLPPSAASTIFFFFFENTSYLLLIKLLSVSQTICTPHSGNTTCVSVRVHADLYMGTGVWLVFPTCILKVVLAQYSISIFIHEKTEVCRIQWLSWGSRVCKRQNGIQIQAVRLLPYFLNTCALHYLRSILKCTFFSSFVFHECWNSCTHQSSLFLLLLVTYALPHRVMGQLELGHYQPSPYMVSQWKGNTNSY